MNKQVIHAPHFGKKPYANPQMDVYEVRQTNIIATSVAIDTEEFSEDTTQGWW